MCGGAISGINHTCVNSYRLLLWRLWRVCCRLIPDMTVGNGDAAIRPAQTASASVVAMTQGESGGDSAPRYYTLADYLSADEAAGFLDLPHAAQVAKVTEYLDFLSRQPVAASFSPSSKAARAHAERRQQARDCSVDGLATGDDELDPSALALVLDGKTRSGFGAFGTEAGFLPQKQLSLAVASAVGEIGHEYAVETSSKKARAADSKPALNSRSFFFYWCHAEKQKLLDVRQKLEQLGVAAGERARYWAALEIVVDRAMCADCRAFCASFARFESIRLVVRDPQAVHEFPPLSPAAAELLQSSSIL